MAMAFYCQITPLKILCQGNVRVADDIEASVALRCLSFRSGQGVFLTTERMQKHRKFLSYRFEPPLNHLCRCGANNNPVPILYLKLEQLVAYCATHKVNFQVFCRVFHLIGMIACIQ